MHTSMWNYDTLCVIVQWISHLIKQRIPEPLRKSAVDAEMRGIQGHYIWPAFCEAAYMEIPTCTFIYPTEKACGKLPLIKRLSSLHVWVPSEFGRYRAPAEFTLPFNTGTTMMLLSFSHLGCIWPHITAPVGTGGRLPVPKIKTPLPGGGQDSTHIRLARCSGIFGTPKQIPKPQCLAMKLDSSDSLMAWMASGKVQEWIPNSSWHLHYLAYLGVWPRPLISRTTRGEL